MKVKVTEIPEEGLDLEFSHKLSSMSVKASASLSLSRFGPDIYIKGSAEARVEMQCGRCLEIYTDTVTAPIEIALYRGHKTPHEDEDEADEADDYSIRLDSDEIDLGQLVEEHVLLNSPMRPLCSEKCKGICPVCGNNLNVEDCGCKRDSVDPRLQVLQKLLKKGEEKNG